MSDVNVIRALIQNISPGDVTNLIAIFSYQGFNPEMVMKHLSKVKLAKAISDDDFSADITALICLGCIAGNYTDKNKQKRDEKGTARADELFSRYELTMGSIGNNKRAITLPRVILTFPILTFKVMMLCPERNFTGPFSTSSLPQSMKNAVFPALIPTDIGPKSKKALLLAYCAYTSDQSKAINASMRSLPIDEVFRKQFEFVEIGHSSPEPSNDARKAQFKVIKKHLEDGWPAIVEVLKKYQSLVDKSYEIPTKFGNIITGSIQTIQQSSTDDLE
jgi:hypothetical protein